MVDFQAESRRVGSVFPFFKHLRAPAPRSEKSPSKQSVAGALAGSVGQGGPVPLKRVQKVARPVGRRRGCCGPPCGRTPAPERLRGKAVLRATRRDRGRRVAGSCGGPRSHGVDGFPFTLGVLIANFQALRKSILPRTGDVLEVRLPFMPRASVSLEQAKPALGCRILRLLLSGAGIVMRFLSEFTQRAAQQFTELRRC